MNGPKKLIGEIGAYKDSMITITGLVKKGQPNPGVNLGGGVRIGAATPTASSGGVPSNMIVNAPHIDVEGWTPAIGSCTSR
jgi:hypothetical protein